MVSHPPVLAYHLILTTYGFWLPDGGSPPEINPLNPKYRLMVEVWRRLPLSVSRLVGPILGPHLG